MWTKPLPGGDQAVLVINICETARDIDVPLSSLGLSGSAAVYDVYKHESLPSISGSLTVKGLASHDSYFVRLSAM